MIPRGRLLKLGAAVLIFAIADIWIYTSLLGSFRSYYKQNSLKEAALFARTAPEDPAQYDEWITGLSAELEGGKALILTLDQEFNFFPAAADPAARAIWDEHKDSEEFRRGLESVYYLLPYEAASPVRISEAGTPRMMRVYLLPIPDESGFDISGAVMIAVPEGTAAQFEGLLRTLSILAWVIFTVLLAVALLARDPITGYAVIFLFAVAIVFIAFPLFESFRLTFIRLV